MKIEVGKSYITNAGWRAVVVADDLTGEFPVLVVHYRDGVVRERRHDLNGILSNDYTLAGPWIDPPKPLECWVICTPKGKAYTVCHSKEDALKYIDAAPHLKGGTAKHMRELVGE